MSTETQKLFLFFFVLAFLSIARPALSTEVVSISITSTHFGFGGFDGKSELKIHKTPAGYEGKLGNVNLKYNFDKLIKEGLFIKKNNSKDSSWFINEKITTKEEVFRRLENDLKKISTHSIPSGLIEQFVHSLNAFPKTSFDFSQLGIDQKWLRERATKTTDKWLDPTQDYYFLLKSRQLKLIDTLSSEEKAHKDLLWYYTDSFTYDDSPKLEAIVTLSNNVIIHLTSESQKEFMIPWKIRNNGQEFTTFDIQISKTLNKLLPEKFLEKKRIQGDLSRIFEEYFWSDEIRGWLNTADSEFKLRGQIDFITNEFNLIKGHLNYDYKNPDNNEWDLIDKGKWEITLSHKHWPKNVFVSTDIQYLSGLLKHDKFSPKKIHFYINKLFEIKWLNKYIENHPYDKVFVFIDQDRSITEDDFNEEIKRLKQNRNYEWKSASLPYHEDIISLSVYNRSLGSSEWLIFPDQTATLHNYRGKHVLNWNSKELFRWKKYKTNYSGARISPNGEIMHPK